MTGVLIEWMSGPMFWLVFGSGLLVGGIVAGTLAASRRIECDEQHERLIAALRRIQLGVHTGWSAEHAAQEAERALDRYQRTVR